MFTCSRWRASAVSVCIGMFTGNRLPDLGAEFYPGCCFTSFFLSCFFRHNFAQFIFHIFIQLFNSYFFICLYTFISFKLRLKNIAVLQSKHICFVRKTGFKKESRSGMHQYKGPLKKYVRIELGRSYAEGICQWPCGLNPHGHHQLPTVPRKIAW